MAVMAKALNKPFYVVAESYKFVRMYPLNQSDLPNPDKVSKKYSLYNSVIHYALCLQYITVDSGTSDHPMIDYTPPQYITLLLTDLGVLTPSAVSDELIKLYM